MLGLSFGHLIILSVIVLLFGSKRIPELGAALGSGMKSFKDGLNGIDHKPVSAEKVVHQPAADPQIKA